MRIIIGGNNRLAKRVTEWLLASKADVVMTVPEGKDTVQSPTEWEEPFRDYAESLKNIPCRVGNVNKFAGEIKNLNPDLIVMLRSASLVRKDILEIPRQGVLNFHYGELPKYGGCFPIQWAIRNGEKKIGVTLHWMNEKFDEGPILAQRTVDISTPVRIFRANGRAIEVRGLTSFEAYLVCNDTALGMFIESFPLIKSGRAPRISQDFAKKSYFQSHQIDFQKEKYIDLSAPEETLAREIRVFTFPPKQLPIGIYAGKELGEFSISK